MNDEVDGGVGTDKGAAHQATRQKEPSDQGGDGTKET
jgi:hypothetical protein